MLNKDKYAIVKNSSTLSLCAFYTRIHDMHYIGMPIKRAHMYTYSLNIFM